MLKTIDFFEKKGKEKLKSDYHDKVWYADFIDFLKKEKIFATLLTPSAYGGEDCRWDTYRNCDFNEILGFYGLPYWYTWQVTILGLGPIWMGNNESCQGKDRPAPGGRRHFCLRPLGKSTRRRFVLQRDDADAPGRRPICGRRRQILYRQRQ